MGGVKGLRSALLGVALGAVLLAAFAWLRPREPSAARERVASRATQVAEEVSAQAITAGQVPMGMPPDGGAAEAQSREGQLADATPEPESALEPAPDLAASAQRGTRASTEMLRDSLLHGPSFRVRMRAAIALGRVRGRVAGDALVQSLTDAHPAVRAAAARSLGIGGHGRAKPALERLTGDGEAAVRREALAALAKLAPAPVKASHPAVATVVAPPPEQGAEPAPSGSSKIYVRVGAPRAPSGSVAPPQLGALHSAAEAQLRAVAGIALAPREQSVAAARVAIGAGVGFFVDLTVGAVEETSTGTSATVTAIIQTYPGRDMKASVKGKATVPGASGPAAQSDALAGALRSAVRKVPGVLSTLAR